MKKRICTINIPDQYLDCLESMVNLGFYPSRSEAIRAAIKQFLVDEPERSKLMDKETFHKGKAIEMKRMMH